MICYPEGRDSGPHTHTASSSSTWQQQPSMAFPATSLDFRACFFFFLSCSSCLREIYLTPGQRRHAPGHNTNARRGTIFTPTWEYITASRGGREAKQWTSARKICHSILHGCEGPSLMSHTRWLRLTDPVLTIDTLTGDIEDLKYPPEGSSCSLWEAAFRGLDAGHCAVVPGERRLPESEIIIG